MGCGASPGEKKATGEAEGTPGNQQQEQLPGEEKGGQGAASGAPSVDKDPAKPQAGVDRKGNTEQESKDDQDGGYNDKEKKNSEGAAKPKASDQKVGTDKPSGTPPKPSIDDMSKPPEWLTKSNTKKHLSFHAEYKGHYRIPSDPNISMVSYPLSPTPPHFIKSKKSVCTPKESTQFTVVNADGVLANKD
uniref:Uncharacterized protein n=1 Tax=Lotharella globosa TaxID=91324 RepID=A0A6V3JIT5_9EUKA